MCVKTQSMDYNYINGKKPIPEKRGFRSNDGAPARLAGGEAEKERSSRVAALAVSLRSQLCWLVVLAMGSMASSLL